ncbi:MAG TPA: SRPBCC family protein [Nitrososphaera sp.]
MRSFRHSFTVDAEISRVWDFYTDIGHLEIISPPELHIRLVKSTHTVLVEGSEVWLAGRLVTESRWHSRITFLKPYEYADEMMTGRFKIWKHVHEFRALDDKTTEVIDEIDFELPYGSLGRCFEGYVLRHLERTFAYRKDATRRAMEN